MPRSHLSPKTLHLVLILLALFSPLIFTSGLKVEAQRKRAAPRKPTAAPAATPQSSPSQGAPKSQKANLVRMRSSDTSDGSNVTLESDGVLNKYSAYRSGDKFYVVVPDLDAQRAQSNLRGRGYENVQVQKNGNDTVLVFRMQPGAKASVRQRFNRLDVVFNTPGSAAESSTGSNQQGTTSNSNQATTRTPSTQPQGGTTTITPNAGNTTQPNTINGGQNTGVNTYTPNTSPLATTAPTPSTGVSPTATETPAASPEATPLPNELAQVQPNAPAAQPPANNSQRQTTTTTSFATTLARNWGLALIIGLILVSLGLVVAARAKSRRDKTDAAAAPKAKEEALDAKPTKTIETAKLKDAATATTAAVVTVTGKRANKERARTTEKAKADESVAIETPVIPVKEVVVDKDAAKEAVPVTTADIEHASAEVRKLLAGESYDEAVVASPDRGTRQAVAAELLAALVGRNAERRARARAAFVKHNYLDEATYDLRTAEAAGERASAARALGSAQDQTATPHLIAALEDSSPEVRRAVIEALAELRDSSAVAPLEALLEHERDRKVPHSLIRRAIEASTPAVEEKEETQTLEAAPAVAAQEETATIESVPPIAAPDEAHAVTETTVASSEAAALSSVEAPTVETPAEVSEPVRAEIVAPPQRADNRKMRKKQARQKRAEEQSRKIAEMEAARQKEQEAAAQAAAEAEAARLLAEEEARVKAEAEARRQAEEEAARVRAEEEARLRAEEEARQRAQEEERQRAEAEARRKAEDEAARLRAEEERRLAEEERQRAEAARLEAEAARLKAEEEARRKAEEEEHRRAEEERQRLEAEAAERRAEEERRRAEAEARARAEEEARRRAEEEARQRAAEEARQRELEEQARLRAEAEARRQAEEEAARLRAEEEARFRAEEEARRRAEEEAERVRAAEEAQRAEEARRAAEEAEVVQVSEADVITETTPHVAAESLIERNDGSTAGWLDIELGQPDAMPASTVSSEPSAVALDSSSVTEAATETAITEWQASGAQPAEQEAAPASSMGLVEEAPAGVSKEIDRAVSEKGIVSTEEEFSTVPHTILRHLGSEDAEERAEAVTYLGRLGGEDAFREISAAFDDPVQEVRNAAARALYELSTDRAASFTRALREAPMERRRQIGAALASSGLAGEAISNLTGESREKTYDAFSLLFLMSKAGEVQPLMRAIEDHPNNEVRLAVVKLLALSGQQEILPAFRRLAVRGSLPTEVRAAVMEAIYQISSQSPTAA